MAFSVALARFLDLADQVFIFRLGEGPAQEARTYFMVTKSLQGQGFMAVIEGFKRL